MIPGVNVETKARCADLDATARRAASHGARFAGVLEQRDTYFDVPRGRLKLRTIEEHAADGRRCAYAELIAYERPDGAGARVSAYTREPVAAPERALERLAGEHRRRGVVSKRRELWLLRRTRIHLDRVESLGDFVELETVATGEVDDDLEAEHRAIAAALGIEAADTIAGSYADLLGL